jgi:hypothetical protein
LVIFLSPSLPWETTRPSGKSPFEAGFARPVHSRTYASPRALLLVSQGSLPAARARFAGRDFHPLDDSTEFQCFIMLLLSVLPFLVAPHAGTSLPQLSKVDRERLRADARSALVNLGFRSGEAGEAVDTAIEHENTLDEILREALRFLRPPLS